jgi:hypothetical protein
MRNVDLMPLRKQAKPLAYPFVVDGLEGLAVSTRPMFGAHAVYVDERVVFLVRRRGDEDDGVWVAYEPEREVEVLASLPSLAPIGVISARGWKKLAASLPSFEEDVGRACAFARTGLLGKVPNRTKSRAKPRGTKVSDSKSKRGQPALSSRASSKSTKKKRSTR